MKIIEAADEHVSLWSALRMWAYSDLLRPWFNPWNAFLVDHELEDIFDI